MSSRNLKLKHTRIECEPTLTTVCKKDKIIQVFLDGMCIFKAKAHTAKVPGTLLELNSSFTMRNFDT